MKWKAVAEERDYGQRGVSLGAGIGRNPRWTGAISNVDHGRILTQEELVVFREVSQRGT